MTSTVKVPTPLVPPGCSCCAATTPSLCHCVCLSSPLHCIHHLFTVSIPDTGAAQSVQTWDFKAQVLLWHSRGRRGTHSTNPSLLPLRRTATLPVGQPTTPALSGSRGPRAFCPALSSQWREVWNLLKHAAQL